jgi:hypothetical protein
MIVRSASLCSTFLFGWSIVLLHHLFLTHGWTTPMSHRRCLRCWCRTNIQRTTPSLLSIPHPSIQRRHITLLFDTVQQSNWKPDNSNLVTDTAGPNASHRRQFLWSTIVAPVTSTMVGCSSPYVAAARGLVQFPCKVSLANTYNLMRVGMSLLEEEGMIHCRNASRLSVAPSLCLQNR